MSSHLDALCIDAQDPLALAHFWAGVLGRSVDSADPRDGVTLPPNDDTGFLIRFVPTEQPKVGRNPMHVDLTSTSLADQQQKVATALALGAQHLDVGQRPEEGHVVLADPEGNEFCVIEPDNNFLAGCGVIGALSCDGSQQVGYFWSAALGWPLVWDQDEETAIQSRLGGPKISWGGPPFLPLTEPARWHLDLALDSNGDRQAEIDRLLPLGATRCDHSEGDVDGVLLLDPDGGQFRLITPR